MQRAPSAAGHLDRQIGLAPTRAHHDVKRDAHKHRQTLVPWGRRPPPPFISEPLRRATTRLERRRPAQRDAARGEASPLQRAPSVAGSPRSTDGSSDLASSPDSTASPRPVTPPSPRRWRQYSAALNPSSFVNRRHEPSRRAAANPSQRSFVIARSCTADIRLTVRRYTIGGSYDELSCAPIPIPCPEVG